MPPTQYNPNSSEEAPVLLPSAPRVPLSALGATLQPPLTRRGHGPGIIIFLPHADALAPVGVLGKESLDPQPQLKWAEEGFAVVAMACLPSQVHEGLELGTLALADCDSVDVHGRFAIIVYDPEMVQAILTAVPDDQRLVCVVSHGSAPESSPVSLMAHIAESLPRPPPSQNLTTHAYNVHSPSFVIPGSSTYHPGSAALAHTRSLVFLRKHLGGPQFDIEKVWDEHTYFEFEIRSVAKTMGTMVQEPYVNHVPTMTGGIGREKLTTFYRDHFIFNNPADLTLEIVSRTVGPDRVIDEFVLRMTHDRVVDWLLPGVPATGKKLSIPMMSVVNVRGDRLYHEHIWWDQGTTLLQAGVLPSHVDHPDGRLRLPVTGEESSRLLLDETDSESNQMFGPEWGVRKL